MAWEWELRDTCQTSVRYAALGDSMLSWSAADGAPTGAADLGDGVGEFWALTDGSLGARERKLRSIIRRASAVLLGLPQIAIDALYASRQNLLLTRAGESVRLPGGVGCR